MTRLSPILLVALLAGACGDTPTSAPPVLNFERPVDIAFACWGGLRITGDGVADATDPVIETAHPLTSCAVRSRYFDLNEDVPQQKPPGQEDLPGEIPVPTVQYYGFVLQQTTGSIGLVGFATESPENIDSIAVNFVDADPLTPGRNSIAVGDLPVAIGSDRAGCHLITANAGSCDLSVVGVDSVVDQLEETPPEIRALSVVDAGGAPVLARPAAMVAEPAEDDQPIGVECPAEPEGLVYIAYPDCNLVAAVRPATGQIEAGIQFNADGTVALTDGTVSCPAACGSAATPTAGPRPITLDLIHDPRVDTRRLAIGAENAAALTIVELGADYLPTAVTAVPLEGDVGITDVALSLQIGMGGQTGFDDEGAAGGQHQFIYGVATDGTVRVADVLGTFVECDTQVDPRYLRGVANVGLLACLPVGDPATPPRRAGARGPGIELPGTAVPLAAVITSANSAGLAANAPAPTDPQHLVGHYAFVTATNGQTYVITIDDDSYPDFWKAEDPLDTWVTLAIAHQPADELINRALEPTTADEDPSQDEDEALPICDVTGDETGYAGQGGPRAGGGGVTVTFDGEEVSSEKRYVLPSVRRTLCVEPNGEEVAISELAFVADPVTRDLAFPDLLATTPDETWFMSWEGTLSRDTADEAVDGPVNRTGVVARDGAAMTLSDPSGPYCDMGVEPYDFAVLIGCDPAQGDAQCGLDETCYVHPDATVATGACLPRGDVTLLAATCRDYLVSRRQYGITRVNSDELRLVPRRAALSTTPLDGCVSDAQCAELAVVEARLASTAHPVDDQTPVPPYTYACAPDPSRAPGIDRCLMTCELDTDCAEGSICSGGFCLEGAVPPIECVPGVQRYHVRAGEAITVIGDVSGYLHPIIEDPATGACVVDPDANPLLQGRIPLTAPACPGPDTYTALVPNPCSTTIDQTELVPDYEAGSCTIDDPNGVLITRDAPAIRFKNPVMTFHLVDPWYPGDVACREDRLGDQMIPTVHPGYQLQVAVRSGFSPLRVANAIGVFPANIVLGPERSLWVIDQGDNVADSANELNTRGQVFRIESSRLPAINVVQ